MLARISPFSAIFLRPFNTATNNDTITTVITNLNSG